MGDPRAHEDGIRSSDETRYCALVVGPEVIHQMAPDDDRRTMYVSSHVETALRVLAHP